ncbi:MAG: DUF3325 domain-containing protein [Cycloclasticus sp.]|jgi:Protein of unknown function (DUF3325).
MIILSCVLAFTGFIFLSLAMKRHYRQVQSGSAQVRQSPGNSQRLVFRVTGGGCLAMSLLLCMACLGVAIGLVQWAGILTLTALQTSLLLTYRPQWLLILIPVEEPTPVEDEFTTPEESAAPAT